MYLLKFNQNPSTSSGDNTLKPYFRHFKGQGHRNLINSFPLLTIYMYLCKLGQNLSTGSEGNAWKRSYTDVDRIRTKIVCPPTHKFSFKISIKTVYSEAKWRTVDFDQITL